jgi:carbon storage regulator
MLVLDRKINEGFWIEGNIFVKVLGVGRRRVKLGIEAPGDLKIVREELSSPHAGESPEERGPSVLMRRDRRGDPSSQHADDTLRKGR